MNGTAPADHLKDHKKGLWPHPSAARTGHHRPATPKPDCHRIFLEPHYTDPRVQHWFDEARQEDTALSPDGERAT
ncbi:hypothetical protein ACFU99_07700 [Streptomyces sp. NPDC057654]|uniref:hypothetical protein n=1 Tax=Streptomyces sp. NPDC057654 TaxID=3346196 RepID=UPI00368D1155